MVFGGRGGEALVKTRGVSRWEEVWRSRRSSQVKSVGTGQARSRKVQPRSAGGQGRTGQPTCRSLPSCEWVRAGVWEPRPDWTTWTGSSFPWEVGGAARTVHWSAHHSAGSPTRGSADLQRPQSSAAVDGVHCPGLRALRGPRALPGTLGGALGQGFHWAGTRYRDLMIRYLIAHLEAERYWLSRSPMILSWTGWG